MQTRNILALVVALAICGGFSCKTDEPDGVPIYATIEQYASGAHYYVAGAQETPTEKLVPVLHVNGTRDEQDSRHIRINNRVYDNTTVIEGVRMGNLTATFDTSTEAQPLITMLGLRDKEPAKTDNRYTVVLYAYAQDNNEGKKVLREGMMGEKPVLCLAQLSLGYWPVARVRADAPVGLGGVLYTTILGGQEVSAEALLKRLRKGSTPYTLLDARLGAELGLKP